MGEFMLARRSRTPVRNRLKWLSVLASLAVLTTAAHAVEVSKIKREGSPPGDVLTDQTRKMGGLMPAEEMALSIAHADIATRIIPAEKRIEGDTTLNLQAASDVHTLILDLYSGYHISAIYLDGHAIPPSRYSNPEGQLRITLPKAFKAGRRMTVRIVYAGAPHVASRPPWEGGVTWLTLEDGTPWVDSSLWGGGCDLLYPCIDHPTRKPATTDLHYTVPAPLMALGNGTLTGMTEKDGWRTWNWHARSLHTYGAVIAVGPYKVLEGDYKSRFGNTIPMRYYYLPGEEKQAQALFAEFPVALAFFESQIGPYPWADEKMGVMRVPFSGLENNTLNGYSIDYTKTPFGFDPLMQHEFSHEFFANQLSDANYDDLWLHEGMGSYMQPLLARYLHGDMDYFAQLKTQRAGIKNEQPLVTGRERTEKEVYADPTGPRGDIYTKGSLVLHTLRSLIGDDAFYASLRQLVYGRDDPKPGDFTPQFGTTPEYLAIVDKTTGKDLKWFFDVYLYRAALPKLLMQRDGDTVTFTWATPDDLPFPMPLDVRIDGKDITLPMTDKTGQITAPANATITPDPHSKILMQSDAIDQYQAWQATQVPPKK